jgi:hypothetical protein
MEFAIVMSIVALLLTLLLQRLGETAGDARRVQLRMAVEALRINAALLQLRCNAEMLEPACWQRALAQRRDSASLAAADSAVQPTHHVGVPGLLRSVALAAGLGEHAGTDGGWTWSSPAPDRLQLEPQGVAHCRLELRWQPQSAAIEVFAVEDRC